MNHIMLDEDIKSITDLRTHATSFIDQVHKTRRPIVITQHGKSAAVILDVKEYEKLIESAELIRDVKLAEQQLLHNKTLSHEDARKQLLNAYK